MAATALLAIALLHTASASLSIRARYRGADFLEHFDFFSADDPTHGWVDYLDRGDAMAAGLVDVADDGTFFMGAGRPKTAAARLPSVRIEGRHSIAGGLAVLDIEAVPVGCGAWPAFWMCNQTDPATAGTPAAWPAGGEIDVLEGVHLSRVSATTLHAGPGCTRKFKSAYAAPPYAGNETWNGDCNAGTGCGIVGADGGMGAGFNDLGGGVYATEFSPRGAAQAIKVWFFPRGDPELPDFSRDEIDTADWRLPVAHFSLADDTGCGDAFKNQKIIFNLAFCGDWAGNVWGASTCADRAATCEAFLESQFDNDDYFAHLHFAVNEVSIFQTDAQFRDSRYAPPRPANASHAP